MTFTRVSDILRKHGRLSDADFLTAFPQPVLIEEGRLKRSALDRQVWLLTPQVVTVGRGFDNTVVLEAPMVSSHHAELRGDGRSWAIVDLESTNGTFLDGRRVPAGESQALVDRTVLGFSTERLAFLNSVSFLQVVRQIQFGSDLVEPTAKIRVAGPGGLPTRCHTVLRPVTSGCLAEQPLLEVLQDIGDRQLSGRLSIEGETEFGWISFRVGQPWDAHTSVGSTGVVAIKDLLAFTSGRYSVDDSNVPGGPQKITSELSAILLGAERRRSKKALALSEGQLRATFESVFYGLISCDAHGRIIVANQRCEEIFGRDKEALQGEELGRLIVEERAGGLLNEATAGTTRELTGRRASGESFPLEVAATRFEAEDEIIWALALQDITPRKEAARALEEAQRALQHSQKMEAVGRMAAGITHDFNNLLAVITGYSEVLLEAVPDPTLQRQLKAINSAGEQGANLTKNLLALCRGQEIPPTPNDVNAIVSGLQPMLARLVGDEIELQVVRGSLRGKTLVDKTQFERVLMNLVINARDAMPDGGRVVISTANVDLDEDRASPLKELPPGRYVRLSVSDTGCGIDDETTSKIFEPFFTTKEEGHGTGLGLSVVYGIVKQCGGLISVRSELGSGTSFVIHLRRLAEENARTAVRDSPRGATVLVLDDEPSVREFVREVLRGFGYEVLVAADGVEGLHTCGTREGEIDLVLSDIQMPNMGGLEFADRIGVEQPGVRLILMSALNKPSACPLPFLSKPFSPSVLVRTVEDVLKE